MGVSILATLIAIRVISLFTLLLYGSSTATLAIRQNEFVPWANFAGIAASGTIFTWSMGWLS